MTIIRPVGAVLIDERRQIKRQAEERDAGCGAFRDYVKAPINDQKMYSLSVCIYVHTFKFNDG